MNAIWAILGIILFTAAVTGSIMGLDRLTRDNPDELAAKWTRTNSLETGYEHAAWLLRTHPHEADLDPQWLAAELISATQWEISPVAPLREDVYQATATATAELMLPGKDITTLKVQLPWDLRVYPRNQGITANMDRKSGKFHHAVVATPLWGQAHIAEQPHPPDSGAAPSDLLP